MKQEDTELITCVFCWDKRTQKTIPLYYLDRANNMRVCIYCPACGRELTEQ